MLLTADKVFKKELHSIKDFASMLNTSLTAIYTAITADKLDYTLIGSMRFIVMTCLTKEYTPNKSPNRKKKRKAKGTGNTK